MSNAALVGLSAAAGLAYLAFRRGEPQPSEATASPSSFPWKLVSERRVYGIDECQGIAYDDHGVMVLSTATKPCMLYRFDPNMQLQAKVAIPSIYGTHAGAIDLSGDSVWVPMEPTVIALRGTLDFSAMSPVKLKGSDGIGRPPQSDMPWCAINPRNGLLYSSSFNAVDRVFGYDTESGKHADTIMLDRMTHGVQGGQFTSSSLYLSSSKSNDIRGFSLETGKMNGWTKVESIDLLGDELEGLCVRNGKASLVLLVNNVLGPDDVIIKRYEPAGML